MHKLRSCQKEDLDELRQLMVITFYDTFSGSIGDQDLESYFASAYNPAVLLAEWEDEESEIYVVEKENHLVAYLKINWGLAQTEGRGQDRLEVQRIYVDKSQKRQGIGLEMIDFAINRARDLGFSYIWLGVWEHNYAAKAFYSQRGFTKVGQHEFPTGQQVDIDEIMELDLSAAIYH